MKPLQSLRFDTLNITLFYRIRSIVSGNFIIDIFDRKIPHQFLAPLLVVNPKGLYMVEGSTSHLEQVQAITTL
jgi:hypothetical protein